MKKILLFIVILASAFTAISCKQAPRPGEVHGEVSYRDRGVSDVIITLTSENDTFSFNTLANGYYYFRSIPPGDYTVSLQFNNRDIDFSIVNYETSENPHLITIVDNGYHVRNIVIPKNEDMGWEGGDDDEEEDDHTLPTAELPILAWYSIPADQATLETYQDLKDCGFNISYSQLSTLEEAQQALELGEQVGVKILFSCSELETNTAEIINQVKDSPALYGYFLSHEPSISDLTDLGEWADRIRIADDEHAIYLNLAPDYADEEIIGSKGYEEYVKEAISEVKPTQISFDFFPIQESGISSSWWQNLEIIKKCGAEAELPFWAFALSSAFDSYPSPEMSYLRLQMYTNLAYGAQCLQYYTYWCPSSNYEAPVASDGTHNEAWDLIKAMNEELQARAGVFVGASLLGVYQTGKEDEQPAGTSPLKTGTISNLLKLNAGDNGAVISHFENGNWEYMMMVNRSHDAGFDYSIIFDHDVQFINRDGSIEDIGTSSEAHLEAGDCAIFRWSN